MLLGALLKKNILSDSLQAYLSLYSKLKKLKNISRKTLLNS